jgi:uncharacterized protein (DUF427 family)
MTPGDASGGQQRSHDPGITIEPNPKRVTVTFNGRTIGDTTRALVMRATDSPPTLYLPRDDVDMTLLQRTTHATHCPYKGDAAYFSIKAGDRVAENAVWTYEAPYPKVAAIKDHVAFYPERVDAIEEKAP